MESLYKLNPGPEVPNVFPKPGPRKDLIELLDTMYDNSIGKEVVGRQFERSAQISEAKLKSQKRHFYRIILSLVAAGVLGAGFLGAEIKERQYENEYALTSDVMSEKESILQDAINGFWQNLEIIDVGEGRYDFNAGQIVASCLIYDEAGNASLDYGNFYCFCKYLDAYFDYNYYDMSEEAIKTRKARVNEFVKDKDNYDYNFNTMLVAIANRLGIDHSNDPVKVRYTVEQFAYDLGFNSLEEFMNYCEVQAEMGYMNEHEESYGTRGM